MSILWDKFRNKQYRDQFVSAQVKRGIPFQIRSLLKNRGMSQEDLAASSGLTQGVISRSANPEYGNLTLNTIIRIASGFDIAFVGAFVPFSELETWFSRLDEKKIKVPSFEDEDRLKRKESNLRSIDSLAVPFPRVGEAPKKPVARAGEGIRPIVNRLGAFQSNDSQRVGGATNGRR